MNVPVFGKIQDENASDKSVNNDVLSEISKYMSVHGLGFILLASLLVWRPMETSMCQYVEQMGEKFPGWDHMTTKFVGIMVIKIGKECCLSNPLNFDQKVFWLALGIKS